MKKITLLLAGLLMSPFAGAAWVYFDNANGTSDEYYDSAITPQGKTTVVKTFSAFSVPNRVPFYDPKIKGKVVSLVKFSSEQSSFEFDCKDKTIQLKSRVFYADLEGKMPIVSYKNNDKVIENDNSDFSKQFQKKPLYSDQTRNLRLMQLACP
jgi:hypothetical protein